MTKKDPRIWCIVPFSRPQYLPDIFKRFSAQTYQNKKLIIVENGNGVGACKHYNLYPDVLLSSEPHQAWAKNEGLLYLKRIGADNDYWTTWDDDDYYGRSLDRLEMIDVYTFDGKFISSKPIEKIQPGEFVKSYDETTGSVIFTEVLGLHDHGHLELVEVELDTGEKFKCTMDHKFRTVETREMLPLKEIVNKGLSIVVNNRE